jgi:hypothetical protein
MSYDSNSDGEHSEASLDQFYGNLRNYVKMVTGGYSNLLMLDARGGLGKTHNVRETLSEEVHDDHWVHQNGYTTPIELYKTLWKARHETAVLFLDDMSGVTRSTKAIDMLKAATDTQGDENVIEYRTSQDIDHPYIEGETLPNTFTFRGSIIMSFNNTPDNRHFDALRDRGTYYNFTLSYQERLDLIDEIAKLPDFSDLSVEEQIETAEWVRTATDPSFEVTVRTFEEVCQMRIFGNETGANWEKMALEVFDMDYEEHLVLKMRESMDMTVDEQVERFIEETGTSRSHYYDVWDEVRDKRES